MANLVGRLVVAKDGGGEFYAVIDGKPFLIHPANGQRLKAGEKYQVCFVVYQDTTGGTLLVIDIP